MRILVTGATGFIGSEVVRQLSTRGLHVRALVKTGETREMVPCNDAEIIDGDLEKPHTIKGVAKNIDAVIHLAARATFERYRVLRNMNVEGTCNLLKECINSSVANFVFASSLFVYDDAVELIDESTVPKPVIDYGRGKLDAENELCRLSEKSGIALCCVRLPHVYGSSSLLFRQVRRGFIILPGSGETVFTHMHVSDAASVLIAAASCCRSGIFPAGDDYPCSWNEFCGVITKYLTQVRVIRIPERISLVATGINGFLSRIVKHQTVLTGDTVRGFNLNLAVKPGFTSERTDTLPEYPTIYEGIPAVLSSMNLI